MLNLGRGNEMCLPPDEQAMYNQYPLDNISPSDTVLQIPPCTAEHLDAQERKDLNLALAHSLEPTPSISYQYPYNSYVSALGVMRSNTPSGSMPSIEPDIVSAPISTTQLPGPSFSSNLHLHDPVASHVPLITIETSGDRAAQRISNRVPIPAIDPQLSRQMHASWLDQFDAHDASCIQGISDEAAQKALDLCCQWQFVLKFFNAVSNISLCFVCYATF
jgi:hypothetical protein